MTKRDTIVGEPPLVATQSGDDSLHHLVVILRDSELDRIANRVLELLAAKGIVNDQA